jgi:hypothetical protein
VLVLEADPEVTAPLPPVAPEVPVDPVEPVVPPKPLVDTPLPPGAWPPSVTPLDPPLPLPAGAGPPPLKAVEPHPDNARASRAGTTARRCHDGVRIIIARTSLGVCGTTRAAEEGDLEGPSLWISIAAWQVRRAALGLMVTALLLVALCAGLGELH